LIEWYAGEGASHLEAGEAIALRSLLGGVQEGGSQPPACEVRMDEDGADFGGVVRGIKQVGGDNLELMIASIEGLATTPTAATGEAAMLSNVVAFREGEEIGSVGDELAVDGEDRGEGSLALLGGVLDLKGANGGGDQLADAWNVGRGRDLEAKRHGASIDNRAGSSACPAGVWDGTLHACVTACNLSLCCLYFLSSLHLPAPRIGRRPGWNSCHGTGSGFR
jgi:hypothetical protein